MGRFYINRFNSFRNCLADFAQARYRDYKNDSFVLSGVISKFCLTFDLSWKVMKDIVREYYNMQDYALGSPSENLKAAFRCGLIEDDPLWIKMLRLRNALSHDYSYELAREVCGDVVNVYIDFFLKFEKDVADFIKNTEVEKMDKYVCGPCGYVYDPAAGDPDSGIAPGTPFEQIPDDWCCPICGVGKDMFEKMA